MGDRDDGGARDDTDACPAHAAPTACPTCPDGGPSWDVDDPYDNALPGTQLSIPPHGAISLRDRCAVPGDADHLKVPCPRTAAWLRPSPPAPRAPGRSAVRGPQPARPHTWDAWAMEGSIYEQGEFELGRTGPHGTETVVEQGTVVGDVEVHRSEHGGTSFIRDTGPTCLDDDLLVEQVTWCI